MILAVRIRPEPSDSEIAAEVRADLGYQSLDEYLRTHDVKLLDHAL